MSSPAIKPVDLGPISGPSLYTGIALEIEEIVRSVNASVRAGRDMRAAQTTQSTADLKAACEQIAEHTHAAHLQAKHLASLLARHLNRNPHV